MSFSNHGEELALTWMFTTSSATRPTAWYLSLHDGATGETGANEVDTGTERGTITLPTVAAGATNTIASPNEFDFTSTQSVRGAFISSSPTWSGSTGLLVSAVLFPSPKALVSGETLRVPCGFAVVSA